ncbi:MULTISPECIES: FeoA domain-containing protein [Halorubrum]|uniref:Ferrous iron transport protein A n=2 Tax=Halorubrum ezzemoulense TaxID=337243 RepID=A0A256JKT0_HALEZ|nr:MULTISPECIES: FeoA domain-containing protein [Halorubrum]MDB2265700.1 FeoA domain-containing protein [Halorubrum ezzemoulense]MDB9234813.1 FeoA domain-containing protein [Halorubrum ezzemoulense]MDB9301927.1 FeoA domain-containing protein [Halorubrum ezzemoulense]OSP08436.1 ferrous iron transport protein A [Halorubrum ezzemoulense DSM 17463]OYR61980.1 ferrous iron transport protein A [Halorubrum ezzemoulense]
MVVALADIPSGEWVELVDVPDGERRARLLRLGLLDGRVECRRRIRNGPVVVRRRGTEVALGRSLAREITVERSAPDDAPR